MYDKDHSGNTRLKQICVPFFIHQQGSLFLNVSRPIGTETTILTCLQNKYLDTDENSASRCIARTCSMNSLHESVAKQLFLATTVQETWQKEIEQTRNNILTTWNIYP